MALTYDRPYQYVNELRLLSMIRTSEHTMFIGTGFANDAYAWVEKDGTLDRLDQISLNVSDYSILTTGPIQGKLPYTVYVVNPDDEQGHASNALTFTETSQIPVIDVKVNGRSVVDDQVANIDLTQYVLQMKQANMLYGTDADGAQKMYDLNEIKGVQNVTLNGEDVPITNNTLALTDIARTSETVAKVTTHEIIYGTDISGNPKAYEYSSFAKKADLDAANVNLGKKQDKDDNAADGVIAIMRSHQSVGSSQSLTDLVNTVNSNKIQSDKVPDLETQIQNIQTTISTIGTKDWKAADPTKTGILNNPVSSENHSIAITDMEVNQESQLRSTNGSIAIGVVNVQSAQNAVAIGRDVQVQGTSGVAIGQGASAQTGVALGLNSVSTGDTVSVGNPTITGSDNKVTLAARTRRITNVSDPLQDTDAATKKYVDDHSSTGSGGMTSVVSDAPLSGAGTSASHLKINKATVNDLGVVRPDGTSIKIDANGVISSSSGTMSSITVSDPLTGAGTAASPLKVNTATESALGVSRPDGSTITINNGVLTAHTTATGGLSSVSVSAPLTGNGTSSSPVKISNATSSAVGAVKPGTGLSVGADGALSVDVNTVPMRGLPFYCVNSASDTKSVQGQSITTPCFLAVIGTTPPQLIYSD